MRLDRNSWHARLNRFVYGQDVELNPNLCPYFWKTVAALPLALFAVVGTLVRTVVHSYQTKSGVPNKRQAFKRLDIWGEEVVSEDSNLNIGFHSTAGLLFAVAILSIVGFLLYSAFTTPGFLVLISVVAAVAALVFGIWYSADLWLPMISSVYKGICPSVEWFDSEAETEDEVDDEPVDEAPVDPELDLTQEERDELDEAGEE